MRYIDDHCMLREAQSCAHESAAIADELKVASEHFALLRAGIQNDAYIVSRIAEKVEGRRRVGDEGARHRAPRRLRDGMCSPAEPRG